MSDHKKPSTERKYVKKHNDLVEDLTHQELDHEFKVEAAHAAEGYSEEGDIEISDRELLRRFRTSLMSNILPESPNIPGFHTCWVPMHSNNMYDTVEFRKRLGYVVVKPEECQNYVSPSNRAGQIEGCVSYNELVLMKVPERVYQTYMADSHHTQPNEQEATIQQNIVNMQDKEGNSAVRDYDEMTGIKNLARKVKVPTF